MTAAGLLKRILRDTVMELRYKDPGICDLFARAVLGGVLKAIASSPKGIYKPDPLLDGPACLVQKLSRQLDCIGDEDRIEAALQRLAQHGFILVLDDQSIVVPFTLMEKSSNAQNGSRHIGARPKGESVESYEARKAAHKLKMEKQTHMLFSIAGGLIEGQPVTGAALARILRASFTVVGGFEVTQTATQAKTETRTWEQPETVQPGSDPVPVSSHAAAAALDSDSISAAAAAALLPRETREEPDADQASNPAANLIREPEPEPKPDPAEMLAMLATARFVKWNGSQAAKAPKVFRRLLDEGYTAEQIEAQIALAGAEDVYGPNWFIKRLRHQYPHPGGASAASAPSGLRMTKDRPVPALAIPPHKHPRVVAHEAWEVLGMTLLTAIGRICGIMDRPDGPDRAEALANQKRWQRAAWDHVAAAYPELGEMAAQEVLEPVRKLG